MTNLLHGLPPCAENGELHVVVETPRGSRCKLVYEPELEVISLRRFLPRGLVAPFDFGFVPRTSADDGDPLDVLLLAEESVPSLCLVRARTIGLIRAMKQKARNDRVIAIPTADVSYQGISSIDDLPEHVMAHLERFFQTYADHLDEDVNVEGHAGPRAAQDLVRRAIARYESMQPPSRRAQRA